MNTIQLECFLSVAEHLNFSRASEELKITQPAVSHQIRSLEEELDVRLFRRTSKSVSLTQEGMLFLPDAQLILKTALSARERLGRHEQLTPFEIGCHNHMELRLLPKLFRKLSAEFPQIRPSVRMIPFPSILEMIANKQIHASFGILEDVRNTAIAFRELCKVPIVLVCAPDHPLTQHGSLRLAQLQGNIILCSPRQTPAQIFAIQNQLLETHGKDERYFTESVECAFTLAKAGIGYTLYPDVAQMRDPDLCYIPVTDLKQRLSFGLYYRKEDDHPIMKQFQQLLKDEFDQAR